MRINWWRVAGPVIASLSIVWLVVIASGYRVWPTSPNHPIIMRGFGDAKVVTGLALESKSGETGLPGTDTGGIPIFAPEEPLVIELYEQAPVPPDSLVMMSDAKGCLIAWNNRCIIAGTKLTVE